MKTFCPFSKKHLDRPYSFWKQARALEPVFYCPEIDHWVITRYSDVRRILGDETRFSPAGQGPLQPVSPEAAKILRKAGYGATPVLSSAAPLDHERIRRIVRPFFAPERLAPREGEVRAIVCGYIDRLSGRKSADLMKEMLYELPLAVLFRILGLSRADISKVKRWARGRLRFSFSHLSAGEQARSARAIVKYWKYSETQVKESSGDFIGNLLREEALRLDEVTTIVFVLLLAGHETTSSMAANSVIALLRNRDSWEMLCQHPEHIPKAVEELLRYDTSVITWRRRALKDAIIAGKKIPAASKLLLAIGAANRDQERFEEPEVLDIARKNPKDHLSFSAGPHYCLGAPLARLELRIILEVLTRAFPNMRLVEGQDFGYVPYLSFRSPARLRVKL